VPDLTDETDLGNDPDDLNPAAIDRHALWHHVRTRT
jgi:hypothetical protein